MKKRRFLSILLSLAMCFSILSPLTALAETGTNVIFPIGNTDGAGLYLDFLGLANAENPGPADAPITDLPELKGGDIFWVGLRINNVTKYPALKKGIDGLNVQFVYDANILQYAPPSELGYDIGIYYTEENAYITGVLEEYNRVQSQGANPQPKVLWPNVYQFDNVVLAGVPFSFENSEPTRLSGTNLEAMTILTSYKGNKTIFERASRFCNTTDNSDCYLVRFPMKVKVDAQLPASPATMIELSLNPETLMVNVSKEGGADNDSGMWGSGSASDMKRFMAYYGEPILKFATPAQAIGGTASITGTATYGETLTADITNVTGLSGTTTYQWQRETTAGSGTYEDITGAEAATYKVGAADIGKKIQVLVDATNCTGGPITSSATAAVAKKTLIAPIATAITVPDLIVGADPKTVEDTYVFTATEGVVENNGTLDEVKADFTATYSKNIQGEDTNVSVALVSELSGAAKDYYTFAGATVTGVKGTVSNLPAIDGTVALEGTATYGQTLTANATITGVTEDKLTYVWKRDNVAITGAEEKTYTLTKEDVGKVVKVEVAAEGKSGIKDAQTAATVAPITLNAPDSIGNVPSVKKDATGAAAKVSGYYKFTDGVLAGDNVYVKYEADYTGHTNALAESVAIKASLENTLKDNGDDSANTIQYYTFAGVAIDPGVNATGSVVDKVLQSIVVNTQPAKLSYNYGDPLELNGLKVDVTYDTGLETFTYPDLPSGMTFRVEGAEPGAYVTLQQGDLVKGDVLNGKPIQIVMNGQTTNTNNITVAAKTIQLEGKDVSKRAAAVTVSDLLYVDDDTLVTGDTLAKILGENNTLNLVAGDETLGTFNKWVNEAGNVEVVFYSKDATETSQTDKILAAAPRTAGTYQFTIKVNAGPLNGNYTLGTAIAATELFELKLTSGGGGGGSSSGGSSSSTTVAATGISLNKTELTGNIGGEATLKATLTPSNATTSVTWSSSNTKVATVDKNGVVKFVGLGTATITAKAGSKTATAEVNVVEEKVEDVLIDREFIGAFIKGYEDGTFRPQNNISRAEVATAFARLMKEKMDETKSYTSSFTDVKAENWYNNYVAYLADFQVLAGYEDGTFRPDNNITRGEMAAVIARMMKLDTTATYAGTFSDVASSNWAAGSIEAAAKAGYFTGYEDGTFKADQNITRAETVTAINRLLKDMSASGSIVPTDVTSSHWAYTDIVKAMNERILK